MLRLGEPSQKGNAKATIGIRIKARKNRVRAPRLCMPIAIRLPPKRLSGNHEKTGLERASSGP